MVSFELFQEGLGVDRLVMLGICFVIDGEDEVFLGECLDDLVGVGSADVGPKFGKDGHHIFDAD